MECWRDCGVNGTARRRQFGLQRGRCVFRLPCPGSMALSFTLCASFFAVPTTASDQLQLDRKLFIDDRIPGVISVDCMGGGSSCEV